MKYLIIISLLSFVACEKEKLPTTPTVINGIVVDENDMPIPGFKVLFYGIIPKGFRPNIITFDLETTSDENGAFSFSQIIPNETLYGELAIRGVKDANGLYNLDLRSEYTYFLNGQLVPVGPIQVSKRKNLFGTTLTVKIKLTKK